MLAPAKINLALHVTGWREDGYHLLDSLVVFADIGDEISVRSSAELTLAITGPEAASLTISNDNLVIRAAELLRSSGQGAAISLVKKLPVSSGIGGGSSDAATTLLLLSKLWGSDLPDLAAQAALGADVPVCVARRPIRMTGIGEGLTRVHDLPEMAVVLVNPRVEVSTPAVFSGLVRRDNAPMQSMPEGLSYAQFIDWLRQQRNDLEAPAILAAPVISEVLSALDMADLARMSGSGATCFGLFSSFEMAEGSAAKIADAHPDWWVKPARITH